MHSKKSSSKVFLQTISQRPFEEEHCKYVNSNQKQLRVCINYCIVHNFLTIIKIVIIYLEFINYEIYCNLFIYASHRNNKFAIGIYCNIVCRDGGKTHHNIINAQYAHSFGFAFDQKR